MFYVCRLSIFYVPGSSASGPTHKACQFLAAAPLQGCTRQTALERQDLSCMYLAHHDLESVVMIITIVLLV